MFAVLHSRPPRTGTTRIQMVRLKAVTTVMPRQGQQGGNGSLYFDDLPLLDKINIIIEIENGAILQQ